jgi:hypothetical protein
LEKNHLDQKIKMTEVIIAAGRGVTTHNLFSINLRGDGYMLANRETKNIIWAWQGKTIAMILVNNTGKKRRQTTNTAVFGETIIFSLRGNSCQPFGSRTGFLT